MFRAVLWVYAMLVGGGLAVLALVILGRDARGAIRGRRTRARRVR